MCLPEKVTIQRALPSQRSLRFGGLCEGLLAGIDVRGFCVGWGPQDFQKLIQVVTLCLPPWGPVGILCLATHTHRG